jgi:hypothetical protein
LQQFFAFVRQRNEPFVLIHETEKPSLGPFVPLET